MRPIPAQHRKLISTDSYYRKCARRNATCRGRITIEHAFIYSGRQISEMWNYVPLCVYHHLDSGLDKKVNHLIALQRATPADLAKYPKRDWNQELRYLKARVDAKNNNH